MGKDHRVTRNTRHAYRTLSNRTKTIRTPGNIFFFISFLSFYFIP